MMNNYTEYVINDTTGKADTTIKLMGWLSGDFKTPINDVTLKSRRWALLTEIVAFNNQLRALQMMGLHGVVNVMAGRWPEAFKYIDDTLNGLAQASADDKEMTDFYISLLREKGVLVEDESAQAPANEAGEVDTTAATEQAATGTVN